MPFVEAGQRIYPLHQGENLLGAGPECDVRLPDLRTRDRVAIAVKELGAFVWATGEEGAAAINGRPLSGEATALFHGDRILLDGATLVFVDDGVAPERPAAAPAPENARAPAPGAAASGPDAAGDDSPQPAPRIVGVLRSLEDGQSYVIDREGFRLGREKRCDIVIPERAVSRLHAEITFVRGRYLFRDLGRTATRVNGRKIKEPYELQIGDVINVGGHEFAFARRPADAQGLIRRQEVTPIRNQVPEAPTVDVKTADAAGGSNLLTWVLLAVALALAAWFAVDMLAQ